MADPDTPPAVVRPMVRFGEEGGGVTKRLKRTGRALLARRDARHVRAGFPTLPATIVRKKDVLFILHGGNCVRLDGETKCTTFIDPADGKLARLPICAIIGDDETPHVYDSPVVDDSVSLPLSRRECRPRST
jgi:hypothetical protein